ncbi:hypothetical protein HY989_02070 [Candidatus Micrarchaeota archaeon]|nr:hypothetical protein [Candidatus Micrarchaeota archaeon]
MEEIQEKIIVDAADEPIEKSQKRQYKKRKPKAETAPKFKLSRFDSIFIQILKEGISEIEELRKKFNLGKIEFEERLKLLQQEGYLNADFNSGRITLSLKAVNEYSPKWKKAADEWLGRKEKRLKQKETVLQDGPNLKEPSISNEKSQSIPDISKTIQAKLPIEMLWREIESRRNEIASLPEDKRKEETIDIMDLMRKFGPTDKQKDLLNKPSPFVERHMPNKKSIVKNSSESKSQKSPHLRADSASTENSPSESNTSLQPKSSASENSSIAKPTYNRAISDLSRQAAELEASGEKCELCKTGFIISVKEEEHSPKFGHCFCGAPYHKDCYEGIIAGDTKCVRCGRKMSSSSDFKVEDAFKQIRDISF